MSLFVDVALPGLWWNDLTYCTERPIDPGCRVVVPLRKTERVGFVVSMADHPPQGEARKIEAVLDSAPPLGLELWELAKWASTSYLCSLGRVLKLMSPAALMRGEPVSAFIQVAPKATRGKLAFCYVPRDTVRWGQYVELLEKTEGGALVLFPEQMQAHLFWKALPVGLKEKGLLWPAGGGKKAWEAWLSVRLREISLVVGSPAATFAPFPSLDLIAIDDECSGAYTWQMAPYFNSRHIVAKRADLTGASFVLGGRMPSSAVYARHSPPPPKLSKRKVRLVSIKRAHLFDHPGIADALPINQLLIQRTLEEVRAKRTVLWVLDRKGYAMEAFCEECGWSFFCPKCGAAMRLSGEGEQLRCPLCGEKLALPDFCPRCRSSLILGRRPGLDILFHTANALLGEDHPTFLWHKELQGRRKLTEMLSALEDGGLVAGSRLVLSLLDVHRVSLIGWINADAEASRPSYDAKFQAFRMIWDSCWRGIEPDEREIIVQSRIPGRGWQKGLVRGWKVFWDDELKERRELSLPPYVYLVEISPPRGRKKELEVTLKKAALTVYDPEADKDILWVKVERLCHLQEVLRPFMHIGQSGNGFPKIEIWRE